MPKEKKIKITAQEGQHIKESMQTIATILNRYEKTSFACIGEDKDLSLCWIVSLSKHDKASIDYLKERS